MKNFLYLIVQCTWGILQSLLGLINFFFIFVTDTIFIMVQ